MNTDFDINFGTLDATPAPVRPDPAAPLFASEDGVVASLSNNECVFQTRRDGSTHVMTFQVLQALDQCREFRPLDEHIARIMTSIPGLQSQRGDVDRVLRSLVSRGLLVEDAAFLSRVAQGSPGEPTELRGVFIRACDRPEQLARLLASLAEYERNHRAGRRYVVLDDSIQSGAIDRHRDLVREFARATGCKLAYIGPSERRRLVDRLARAVPQAAPALPSLLLRGDGDVRFGGGRGWNLALLLSAGARMVLLDDDHVLPLRQLEDSRAGLDPDPSAHAVTRFHRNLENACGAGEEFAGDPLEAHLDVAGARLGALASTPRFAVDRAALRGLSLARLQHLDGAAPVRTTLQGSYGSSRTESALWLYRLDAAEAAEFRRDRASYLRNIEAGSIWYGYRQAHVGTTGNFSPFAFDNSVLMPCANATGRGEDALFARVLRLIQPDSLTIELPVAIGHLQDVPRKRSDRTRAALTPRFNYFVRDYVDRQLGDFHAAEPEDRLRLLAAHLRDIAAASPDRRLRLLNEYLTYARADLIERLQHQFESSRDAPVYWQADVRTIIEANGKALATKAPPRLGDWPEEADGTACARALAEAAGDLAAGYEAWPSLWAHARDAGGRLLGAL